MNGADIILADEPTGAPDSESGKDVLKILRELNTQGRTIILVTHDMQVAASAHRIVEIREGRIVGDRIVAEQSGQARLSSPGPFVAQPLQSAQSGFAASRLSYGVARAIRTQAAYVLTMLGVVIGIGIASVMSAIVPGAM
ncbi:MAG: Macrolide export ATP-binding/permease protein MacB (EC [uncultured Caballeronia sp.]|nr:MAG: Macrolide export ATP-binding/permease protein MacB (EC [uncultured Caballeronia sp.]